ncbi:MAG: 3-dehydroquinate synthase [Eubacteriales bacterium]|nr:3-dehydroquinate synthase [Eubacteriales bacterium]
MELDRIGTYLSDIQPSGKICVISDSNVAPLYMERCATSLESEGYETYQYILPAGESSKNGENYLKILEYLASVSLTRSDGIVALGGGMVGDIAGFAAATYMRGINVYQVPTTLLAAVDSSVGGKTAIELSVGKNLAGAFHQPKMVLQDSSLLDTIPADIYREGMAEVIKYGMIEDEALFQRLKDPKDTREHLDEIIQTCVNIKKKYVEADEFDRGIRHMLNFGHTLGHAIEMQSNLSLSHGDSVAKGMYWITKIAVEKDWCSEETLTELVDLLKAYDFDLTLPADTEEIYRILCSDKKRSGDTIRMIVPEDIGKCCVQEMNIQEVRNLL